jgi:hypothetical protein
LPRQRRHAALHGERARACGPVRETSAQRWRRQNSHARGGTAVAQNAPLLLLLLLLLLPLLLLPGQAHAAAIRVRACRARRKGGELH